MSNNQKSIVGGVTVLGLSGFICKIVGALYRIPLTWIVGVNGLAIYQLVFPTYNILLTVSAAGLPVAISRMVSFSLAQNDPRSAKRIFRIALFVLGALGCISTALMIYFSPQLAERVLNPEARLGFVAIAPAVLLVCIMSALRGFMQGQQNMAPTAISQLIEQVGKVVIILPMAYYGIRVSPAFAAAMVLLGNTIAEAIALLYMAIACWRSRKVVAAIRQDEEKPIERTGTLMRRLFSLSIPIALGSCIIPMAGFIDSGMVLGRLAKAGIEQGQALILYGSYSGYVISLINVPTALSIAIAMSLVPAISSAIAREDRDGMKKQGAIGIRFSFLIGLPCSIGMSMLSGQILSAIYRFDSPEILQVTSQLLSLSSLTIVLFTVTQSTEGILQGLHKQRIPMYSLMAGVAVKISLNYTLMGNPNIHIYGAPLASIACYTVSMIPNLYFTHKHMQMKADWKNMLGRPLLATAGMAAVLYGSIRLLPQGRFWTLLLILIGIGAYLGFALLFGAMSREDVKPLLRRFGGGTRAA